MIYTAPCVRFLMGADRLRGEVGGLGVGAGNREFCGPCEIARADRRVLFGAHKTRKQGRKVALTIPPCSPPTQHIRNRQQTVRCTKGPSVT